MIYTYLNKFEKYDREINVLYNLLIFFLLVLTIRVCFLIYSGLYDEIWKLIAPAITLVSAMIITRSANRLIENEKIVRADEKRIEIVQVTHHLIAITKDLKQRVGYVKKLLSDGDKPAFALVEIAKSVESRYESLYERDLYRYLPGNCVDIITNISGSVYGIITLAIGIDVVTSQNKMTALKDIPNNGTKPPIESITKLEAELKELIDELFSLRTSLEKEKSKSAP